ncbi:MAG: 3-hydroxyacyl-CoA dehydrogenase NAD-binding domain-containing protein [Candidatus Kapabacteria bacterium]|nr:3-hydroxyacyl-CoA dehydrogenase NAD-binding domain-containing protein [Candidatus Kapabacteria bacterium]
MGNGRIGIVGAGTMGRGIALASLLSGFRVTLSDTTDEALANAQQYIKSQLESLVSKGKISPEQSSQAQNALTLSTRIGIHHNSSLVIESIIEQRQAKMELLKQLEEILPSTTIIATNTSSISINSLAAPLRYPQRFIGIHFFNPAHIMKLVEIIPSYYTDQSVIESAIEYARNLNKEPVVVRDVPGFLVNRVVRNYYNEALRIVSEGAATIEQVDRLMEGAGFRMGPFRLMDLIGIDTNLNVTKSIYEQYFYEPRYQPSPLQQSYVDAGLLGKKSGRGFYTYENNT